MAEILFWLAAFFAEVIGTMAGFGSSTVFLPIALFFLDFKTALTLVAIFHISGNIGRITFFRHGFNRRLLLIFGLPSILLTLFGALLVNYAPSAVLKFILGVFLLVFSLASLSKPDISFSPSTKNSFVGGSLSGFFAGIAGSVFGLFQNVVSTDGVLTILVSFYPLMAILVGGIRTFSGPILGVGILILVEELSMRYTERVELISGLVFVLVILLAPAGVVGLLRTVRQKWFAGLSCQPDIERAA